MESFDIKRFKVDNVNEATHFEMSGKKGGKFKIPLSKKNQLYEYIIKNPNFCITERPQKVFPLYFDIDNLEENKKIDDIIDDIILPNINKVLDLEAANKNNIEMYSILQNKSKPNYYHIHFPKIIVNKIIAKKIATLINTKNGERLLDLSVYTNGLRLFKTLKPKEKNSFYEFIDKMHQTKNLKQQINLVSIHIPDDTPLTPIKNSFQMEFEEEKKKDKKKFSNDTLSELCNTAFKLKNKWTSELKPGKDNQYILKITDSNLCLAEYLIKGNRLDHSTQGHSCIYINKNCATVTCLNHDEHGHKKLDNSVALKKIKELLGLVKSADDLNDYEQLCEILIKYAKKRNYKRSGGYIMKPNKDIPIVYERLCLYKDFINKIFTTTKDGYYYRLFRKKPKNFKDLLTYLETYGDINIDFIKVDHYIFAFKNGYLDISELFNFKFIPYNKMPKKIPTTTVYHDHNFDPKWIDMLNKDNIANFSTPKFDQLLTYQFKHDAPDNYKEIYGLFLGMTGRLHYPTNKYDKLNCMLFIKGGSNTGKSTTGNILMYNHQNIGTISSKMEDTFGLESFVENQNKLIYCSDLPLSFHRKLDKGDLQKMISAENLSISRKGKVAINDYPWTAPLFFIGNYFPQYNDSSGAIPRRLAVFFMNNPVKERDSSFEEHCIKNESHFILLKSLYYYRQIIKKFKGQTFEDWNMKYFKDGFGQLMTTCNNLFNFLTLAPEEFEYWPMHVKGAEMPLKGPNGFKKKYEKYLYMEKAKQRKWVSDPTTLGRRGFRLISKHICCACNKERKGNRTEPCCENFSEYNIREKQYILNMKIIDMNTECEIDDRSEDSI